MCGLILPTCRSFNTSWSERVPQSSLHLMFLIEDNMPEQFVTFYKIASILRICHRKKKTATIWCFRCAYLGRGNWLAGVTALHTKAYMVLQCNLTPWKPPFGGGNREVFSFPMHCCALQCWNWSTLQENSTPCGLLLVAFGFKSMVKSLVSYNSCFQTPPLEVARSWKLSSEGHTKCTLFGSNTQQEGIYAELKHTVPYHVS